MSTPFYSIYVNTELANRLSAVPEKILEGGTGICIYVNVNVRWYMFKCMHMYTYRLRGAQDMYRLSAVPEKILEGGTGICIYVNVNVRWYMFKCMHMYTYRLRGAQDMCMYK